ncbi:clan AA aspartic protease [Nostoc sp. FACHB-152]|uniref:retropepsin-like aspartic protease n=1 Tax=unclassified Nostoc TaxID=2593658 RepID=UPI001689AD70|nr:MULTISPECIES: retropepsin-like aspartic protease [unclassified Nostoc]MBD2446773.1 clan AA aspartic protease [Nostoc sp. FACHB-152]MBD2466620.1 clan AA aspartic protease [Nostoc sp. FACHB-145]
MQISIRSRWKKYQIPTNQNSHRGKSLLSYVLIPSIYFSSLFPLIPTPAAGQIHQKPATSLGQQLLQEVIKCTEAKSFNQKLTNQAQAEAIANRCALQVVALGANGQFRPDAFERMAAFMEATGVKLPQPIGQGQASTQLSFAGESSIFTVPVRIGKQTQTFILDTGNSQTIINTQIAQQLGLNSSPVPKGLLEYKPVVGNNLKGIEVNTHVLPVLGVNSATVAGIHGLGLPTQALPKNITGVLGLDFLSNFDVVLNPKKQQLQLLPPSKSVAGAIPLKGSFGILTAQVYINGQGPFTFAVDTGAYAMMLSPSVVQKLGIDHRNAQTSQIFGFGGRETVKKVKLTKLQIQQHQATEIDAVIVEQSNILKLPGVDGIIGQNFLNRYQQHWRFSKPNALGVVESGSLVLIP